MPWIADDAPRRTHKAKTRDLQELWAKVANETLERSGDEGRARSAKPTPLSPGRRSAKAKPKPAKWP